MVGWLSGFELAKETDPQKWAEGRFDPVSQLISTRFSARKGSMMTVPRHHPNTAGGLPKRPQRLDRGPPKEAYSLVARQMILPFAILVLSLVMWTQFWSEALNGSAQITLYRMSPTFSFLKNKTPTSETHTEEITNR